MGSIVGRACSPSSVTRPVATSQTRPAGTFAGTSPITRASGKKSAVSRRYVHNDRLLDALTRQAFTAIRVSPGARAYYDTQRHRGVEHNAALRHLANRFVGILHGCLASESVHDEHIAWTTPAKAGLTASKRRCHLTS
ncbi:transposase [Rhodococcus koreensis]